MSAIEPVNPMDPLDADEVRGVIGSSIAMRLRSGLPSSWSVAELGDPGHFVVAIPPKDTPWRAVMLCVAPDNRPPDLAENIIASVCDERVAHFRRVACVEDAEDALERLGIELKGRHK